MSRQHAAAIDATIAQCDVLGLDLDARSPGIDAGPRSNESATRGMQTTAPPHRPRARAQRFEDRLGREAGASRPSAVLMRSRLRRTPLANSTAHCACQEQHETTAAIGTPRRGASSMSPARSMARLRAPGPIVRKITLNLRLDLVHLAIRRFDRRAGREPADDGEERAPRCPASRFVACGSDIPPAPPAGCRAGRRPADTNPGRHPAVISVAPSIGIVRPMMLLFSCEAPTPECVADHHHRPAIGGSSSAGHHRPILGGTPSVGSRPAVTRAARFRSGSAPPIVTSRH